MTLTTAAGRAKHADAAVELDPLDRRALPHLGAEADFEYLVKDVHGTLVYTVAIERADVLYAGHTEVQPQVLRVTMMFRHERGGWKIIHRHADMMVDLQLPTP